MLLLLNGQTKKPLENIPTGNKLLSAAIDLLKHTATLLTPWI